MHAWDHVRLEKSAKGAWIHYRKCRLCGMESTNQSFARAKVPWCYAQQWIDFENRGLYDPPPPKPVEWTVVDGRVIWLDDLRTDLNEPGSVLVESASDTGSSRKGKQRYLRGRAADH
jgi:hypothetical protein